MCAILRPLMMITGLLTATALFAAEPEFVPLPTAGEARFRPADEEGRVPQQFRMPASTFPFRAEFLREAGDVRIYHVEFPSPVKTDVEENNTVHAEYYQPKGAGPYPGCVVLHILGGGFELSQMIAQSLADQEIAALFIKMPYYGERRSRDSEKRMISRDPHETAASMTQAVLDIRRGAAWLSGRPEVDADQLGVTGISLGGIMTTLSAAAEPRFKKAAIYLAGGHLGEMLWKNEHPEAEQFRREWVADGGTRESFLKALEPVDPCTHARLLANRKLLIVAARNDEIFPRESTEALWELCGKPRLVWLDAGHITSAKFILGELVRLQQFFAPEDETEGRTP